MLCLTPDGQIMNDSILLKEDIRLLSRYKQYVEGQAIRQILRGSRKEMDKAFSGSRLLHSGLTLAAW